MCNLKEFYVEKIAETCLTLYNATPKTGKPVDNEWTVLSCIVKININQEIEVVSLGTGSKCIGATKMSPRGDILNDSHAEVFARRGFLLYLYDNIDKALLNQTSIFTNKNGKLSLQDGIEFCFYSSQLPCGDASIIPKAESEDCGEIIQLKHKLSDSCDIEFKRPKLDGDIYRTGAKCLPDSEQDLKGAGLRYHALGQVRTKPGRGDRTLSVSCSDKIAKWIHMGIQGSLISLLCDPIYIKHFIFGEGQSVPYSEESLHRALLNRHSDCVDLRPVIPKFHKTAVQFQCMKTEKSKPAAGSIVWVKSDTLLTEVAVQGRKLGLTKKKVTAPVHSLCISKYNLYRRFVYILNTYRDIKNNIIKDDNVYSVPYNAMKRKATDYYEKWLEVKEMFFKTWTVKPDLWDFVCSEI